ncbi:efflux RND transporter permease subunit [Moritella sp.]|uniref:efflux RND transporter permease subunit n=1 Tax=Moritella sp. TaxID=78556 RepID=UPI001D7D5406|nr:efflux RND transporter permease subunit [Moritella sp.]MCJ8352314.1 efflux RND transporter permease subunit [Moritella sp.]NQZ42578.1 efflux RND transporter permease subunit [Moritella sp.]
MHNLIAWFTRNHVAANLLMILILGAGFFTLKYRVNVEVFPDVTIDVININIALPGASPEEAEESLAIPIEEAILDIEGIDKITSRSTEGSSTISVEVDAKYDQYRLKDEIKNRIDALNTLPASAEKPIISQPTSSREVISVMISGELAEKELRLLGEQTRDRLLDEANITQVTLESVRPYEISIEVSEQTLRQYNLTMDEIAAAINANSVDLSGGSIKTPSGEILLRSKGQAYVGSEYANIMIRSHADGTRLILKDIATIKDGFEETPIITRFNGKPAVIIEVYRVGAQSAITIADTVKAFIVEQQALMPAGVKLDYWRDDSKIVKSRINTLSTSAIQGGILVAIMLTLFLRPAIAFWVTVGIPVSFMGGAIFMPELDISINIISLFAFIMVLGILVDDAIVSGENVYTHLKRGEPPERAAIIGIQEVSTPVTFGILTTIVAFIPLTLIEGARGDIFAQIPAIVIPVLLFSLIESKLILPAHLKHIRMQGSNQNRFLRWQERFANNFEQAIIRYYRPALSAVLARRYLSLTVAFSVMLIVLTLVTSGWVRFIFFPRIPSEIARGVIVMPTGTDIAVTDKYVQKMLDSALLLQKKYTDTSTNESVIKDIFATVGSSGGSSAGQSHRGRVIFQVQSEEERVIDISVAALVKEWRALIGHVPGAQSLTFKAETGHSGSPLNIQLTAHRYDSLRSVADKIKHKLTEYPSVFDIEDSISTGKTELQLAIKPEAEALGLSLSDLAQQVRQAFYGEQVQRIQRGKDDVKVFIRYPENERQSIYNLNNMMIRTPAGDEIPFLEVAEITDGTSPSVIIRIDRQRTLNITADLNKETGNLGILKQDLTDYLDQLMQLYPDVSYSLEGEAKEQDESFSSLKLGLVFVLFAIYALLAIPFRSYTQPLIVMSVIPFGAIGAILGHIIMGNPLTLMSVLGMLALTGVVVNDSLVLVDYINKQRAEGVPLTEAVNNAGVARFRAVMLTSITTFVGLMPLLLETSIQAQFLIPMAISLGFGIIFATVITLFIVPINYLLLEDCGRLLTWLKHLYRRRPNDTSSKV